jgi:hypothetical protein
MMSGALVFVLRCGAVLTGSAFLALFLPVEWMASTHRWLGLGEFPRTPIVDYLARSVAAFYGFHGVLLLVISTDVVRFRPLVWFVAVMNVVFGFMLLAIDIHAGLPRYWIAFEGPPVVVIGLLVAFFNWHAVPVTDVHPSAAAPEVTSSRSGF